MRHVALAVVIGVAAVVGVGAYEAAESLARRALGLTGEWDDALAAAAAIAVALGLVHFYRRWVRGAYRPCSKCDSLIRVKASRCVYCRTDVP